MKLVDFCLRRNRGSQFERELENAEVLIIRALAPVSLNIRSPVFFGALGRAWANQMENAQAFGVLSARDRAHIATTIIQLLNREKDL